MKPKTYCRHYHYDVGDDTDPCQCWAVIDKTNGGLFNIELLYHPSCEGNEKRCDFKRKWWKK